MTEILLKKFVKNSENVTDPEVRTAYGVFSSVVCIICNIALFILKITIGLIIGSISVTADAFNNLSDAVSNIIGFVGVKLADKPADEEHPFGHGRYEYIAALIVAFLVFEVGVTCFKSSFSKILHPEKITFIPVLVVFLIISILVKLWMAAFNKSLGKKVDSQVLFATAADSRGDVLVTSATVISIIVGHFSGLLIDGYMGVVVSLVVLYAGFGIAKDTIQPLLGEAVDREIYDKITQKVMSYKEIVGTHDLIVHSYGPARTMATIHAEVPNDMKMDDAHEIIDQIERDVLRDLRIFLVIHMDPVNVHDEEVCRMRDDIMKIVGEVEKKASIHDFRMVKGTHHSNLVFDLVAPTYNDSDKITLTKKVREAVKIKHPDCDCVITVENSYISSK